MTFPLKLVVAIAYAALLAVMAVATFFESSRGTGSAHRLIYDAPWFAILWAVVAVGGVLIFICRRKSLKAGSLLLHLSFLIILVGALLTSLTSHSGTIHLRQDRPTATALTSQGDTLRLPFTLCLDSFVVRYYRGTAMPRDFESHITIDTTRHCLISMNNIARVRGYRLYQTSYDIDLQGSLLSFNCDPYGLPLTYAGYALLFVALLWLLIDPRGPFRAALRHLGRIAAVAALLCAPSLVHAGDSIPTLSRQKADSLGRKQIVYNNRVVPFNTLARDFCTKIYGRPSYRGLTAEQVLAGWILCPEPWVDQPMIRVKSAKVRKHYGLPRYARFRDLFDDEGKYRISSFDTSARALDEQAGLIVMALQGVLFEDLPVGQTVLSEQHVSAELLLNRLPLPTLLAFGCLALGLLSVLLLLPRLPRRGRRLVVVQASLLGVAWLLLTLYLALRWYVKGSIPLSNGYETMLLIAWFTLLLSALAALRLRGFLRRFILMGGFLVSGFFLLVSHIGAMDPAITNLMPVLNSPLLSFHVAVIMMAYALLSLNFLCSLAALVGKGLREQLSLLALVLLYPAITTLGIGIFLGAVWAAISWGSYWSWDPKETWALITLMVYAVPLHRSLLRSPRSRSLYLVLAFATLLMTYFGVNYLLGGLHSYA